VLFDVVPGIKFQDAIELVGMQPLPSTTAAWKRFITISAVTFYLLLMLYFFFFGLFFDPTISISMCNAPVAYISSILSLC
jgi:hypothetical protein